MPTHEQAVVGNGTAGRHGHAGLLLTLEDASPRLLSIALAGLKSGEVLAARIPNFASERVSQHMVDLVTANPDLLAAYENDEIGAGGKRQRLATGVRRFGPAYALALLETPHSAAEAAAKATYYRDTSRFLRLTRTTAGEEERPVDRLHRYLDAAHPGGAQVARYDGTEMYTGTLRETEPRAQKLEARPHVDSLPRRIFQLRRQLSANIFHAVPESGGDILFWNGAPFSQHEIDRLDIGAIAQRLSAPAARLRPERGDLVLFQTQRFHAVETHDGYRLAEQVFIGVRRGWPLLLWN